jgi:hypothetical protein
MHIYIYICIYTYIGIGKNDEVVDIDGVNALTLEGNGRSRDGKQEGTEDDNDAFMDEMEDICN